MTFGFNGIPPKPEKAAESPPPVCLNQAKEEDVEYVIELLSQRTG